MTQSFGSLKAHMIANGHEVDVPNPTDELQMDFFNNAVGRAVGENPAYKHLSADQAADLALKSGRLQKSLGGR